MMRLPTVSEVSKVWPVQAKSSAGYQRRNRYTDPPVVLWMLEIIDIAQKLIPLKFLSNLEDCCIYAPDRPKTKNLKLRMLNSMKHVWMLKDWLSEQ